LSGDSVVSGVELDTDGVVVSGAADLVVDGWVVDDVASGGGGAGTSAGGVATTLVGVVACGAADSAVDEVPGTGGRVDVLLGHGVPVPPPSWAPRNCSPRSEVEEVTGRPPVGGDWFPATVG